VIRLAFYTTMFVIRGAQELKDPNL